LYVIALSVVFNLYMSFAGTVYSFIKKIWSSIKKRNKESKDRREVEKIINEELTAKAMERIAKIKA